MAIIVFLYNKFTGEIIRQERLSDSRARDINIYNFSPKGMDTLSLKLRLIKEDIIQSLMVTNIDEINIYPKRNRKVEIGVIFQGGLGDHVIARALIEGFKKMYGNIIIYAYCYRSAEILNTFEEIKEVSTLAPNIDPQTFAKNLSLKYEVVYDLGLIGARYENGKLAYTKYPELYKDHLKNLDLINKKFPKKHIFQVRGESIGLRNIKIDDIDISISSRKNNYYITISGFSNSKIKEWDKWEKVIEYVNDHNIEVRQLGTKQSHLINGTIDKRGIKIEEVIDQIGNSLLHLDGDSGLVHLARSTGTHSLVLFGSTSKDNWGYKENKNIVSRMSCPFFFFFLKEQWRNCLYTKDKSGRCMNEIDYERVIHGVN